MSNRNSELEEEPDYIKEYIKFAIEEHTKQLYAEIELLREGLRLLLEDAKITEKNHFLLMDNANMTAETLERAKKTLIGKAIFK